MLELLFVLDRSQPRKEAEILLLQNELRVLRRQVARPQLRPADRLVLAEVGPAPPHVRSSPVEPATLLRWHRELVRRRSTFPDDQPPDQRRSRRRSSWCRGWPRRTPAGGYKRIHGELSGLANALSPSSVWSILRRHGIDPAPRRAHLSWSESPPASGEHRRV